MIGFISIEKLRVITYNIPLEKRLPKILINMMISFDYFIKSKLSRSCFFYFLFFDELIEIPNQSTFYCCAKMSFYSRIRDGRCLNIEKCNNQFSHFYMQVINASNVNLAYETFLSTSLLKDIDIIKKCK
jgi:hypothetical protein